MTECPRAAESGRDPILPLAYDADRRTCNYCGSWHQDDFMVALEAGTVAIGATDKDYKIYVSGDGVPKGTIKFYFQHLTVEQRKRFIELVNEKKIVWQSGERGFYVLPFFMCYADGRPSPIR